MWSTVSAIHFRQVCAYITMRFTHTAEKLSEKVDKRINFLYRPPLPWRILRAGLLTFICPEDKKIVSFDHTQLFGGHRPVKKHAGRQTLWKKENDWKICSNPGQGRCGTRLWYHNWPVWKTGEWNWVVLRAVRPYGLDQTASSFCKALRSENKFHGKDKR